MGRTFVHWVVIIAVGLLAGCVASPVSKDQLGIQVPDDWSKASAGFTGLKSHPVIDVITQAVNNNQQLKQQALDVEIMKQLVTQASSSLRPDISAGVSAQRQKSGDDSYSTNNQLTLNIAYQIDIFGDLSDTEKSASLDYLAAEEQLKQAQQQLSADVLKAWLDVVEANRLLTLFKGRETSAEENLRIVERGHQLGLNEALDVYLARNELNNERSRVASQESTVTFRVRALERLMGGYPVGKLLIDGELPLWDVEIGDTVPSALIEQKPSLKAAWYDLMAADSSRAAAQKRRFPTLDISASLRQSGRRMSDLLDLSTLGWSLVGGMTAPLFNAGRLKSNADVAKLQLEQLEQRYIDAVYDAFEDVENALTLDASLKKTLATALAAEENAIQAETLSFDQYQKGLVDYATVLVSQQRSLEAQITAIQLKKALAANRVDLMLALGGNGLPEPVQKDS